MPASPSRLNSSVESLESRIAPAGVTYTYTDVDGDSVTVKISKGTLPDVVFTKEAMGLGDQLVKIDLGGHTVFQGATITVTAVDKNGFGNGKANVQFIDATGIDLAGVTVSGDLGRIEAGDANLTTAGLKLLSVDSMRFLPLTSGAAPVESGVYETVSHIKGALTSLVVKSDFANAGLSVDSLGTATISGSLIGNPDSSSSQVNSSGQIYSNGSIGTVVIKGDLRGGAGTSAGSIIANAGNITSVTIGGSLIGGSGSSYAGAIYASGTIGTVTVAGDVHGGLGIQSGFIYAAGNPAGASITKVAITGSLIGGSANDTGEIFTAGKLTTLTIGGQLVGGDSQATALQNTGYIQALTIQSATIGGIVSGTKNGMGGLANSGSIRAVDNIVTLTVKRDITGNTTNPVYITAFGAPAQTTTDIAISTLTVGGAVRYSEILAGYNVDATSAAPRGSGLNGDAQIGKVTIAGNFTASSLIAGIASTDAFFGNADDVSLPSTSASIVSSIASVVIGGQAYGTSSSTDAATFGIGAQKLGTVKIGATTLNLLANASTDTFAAGKARPSGPTLGTTNTDTFDFHVYEVV